MCAMRISNTYRNKSAYFICYIVCYSSKEHSVKFWDESVHYFGAKSGEISEVPATITTKNVPDADFGDLS